MQVELAVSALPRQRAVRLRQREERLRQAGASINARYFLRVAADALDEQAYLLDRERHLLGQAKACANAAAALTPKIARCEAAAERIARDPGGAEDAEAA